jgi:Tol biopolymer transport system component
MFGPDNQTVLYQSDRNGNWDIYVLDVASGTERQLTSSTADDVNACWSPDADWLIFQSNRSGTWNIYLLQVSTGTEYTVTDRPYDIVVPSWSPNGRQISFFTDWGGQWDLFVMDVDGSNVKRITDGSGNAGNATWSPEGDRIAYQVALFDNESTDVFTYDLTNDQQYQLTSFTGADSAPTWDCGGSNISFTSLRY